MLMKHCNWKHCTKLVPSGQAFCDIHKKQDDERRAKLIKDKVDQDSTTHKEIKQAHQSHYNQVERDPEANQFYHSKDWREMRDYVYSRNMAQCQICGESVNDRKIIDHVHPLKVAPAERLNSDNLWTLCYQCHYLKTKTEERIKAKPNGDNVLKHASIKWWKQTIKKQRERQNK